MKKILHISKYYYPYKGGTEVVCQDIAEGLPAYQNKIICFNNENKDKIDIINGIEVIRCGTFIKIASQPLSFSYFKKLKEIIQSWQPDAIHFHHPNPFVALLILSLIPSNTKLIVHWHLDIFKQKFLYFFIKSQEHRLLERADTIIVTSPNYRDNSIPLRDFISKTIIINNGIDINRFKIREGDNEHITTLKQKYNNAPIIFFVGRHVPYKGLKYLIEAEKYIQNNCAIIIAGEGVLTPQLKQQTKSNRVFFIGKISEDELKCYMYAADIFAFPSITKNEAFGLALAEGMFCNAVPVTFKITGSGVNYVSLNGITGIEVENSNSIEYAKAIDTILSNEELKKQYAKAAHDRVLKLFTTSQEQIAAQNLYNKLFHK